MKEKKIIVFEKEVLLFVFNVNPNQSFEHYKVGTKWASDHRQIFESDDVKILNKEEYGGFGRLKSAYN